MNIEKINNLIANIVFIQHKKNKDYINYKLITVEKLIAKCSNTKNPIYKLKIDNKLISKNNPYIVKYKCISCPNYHIVALNNISRKINKNQVECRICKELNIDKRKNQSDFLIDNGGILGLKDYKKPEIKHISNKEFIILSEDEFKEEEDEFQHIYYRKHLTIDEFERIRNKIISIQTDKFLDISHFQYIPTLHIHNQTKYNPHFYNIENDTFEKINYIKFQCDLCDNTFINRDLYIQKNRLKILCQDCNFVNNTFKIRHFKNCIGVKITYQSKLELKFIMYCNKNNIKVENGPKINYTHNSKQKRYIIDFYLPQLNTLIEIKDNHCWHKENIKNGKWGAKINAVKKIVENNTYKEFILIYSNELIKKCNLILKKIKEL
jgi:hypothetical protein